MRPFTVCARAPPPHEVLAAAPAVSSIDDELNRAACALIDSLLASGAEVGLHAIAYHRGHLVLDVVAGVHARQDAPVDASGNLVFEPVTPETRFMCFSVSKGVAATVIARALQRPDAELSPRGAPPGGLAAVDDYPDPYDRPVASLWPEFAQHGKASVTIGDALSHRAGLRPLLVAPVEVVAAALSATPLCASAGAALVSAARAGLARAACTVTRALGLPPLAPSGAGAAAAAWCDVALGASGGAEAAAAADMATLAAEAEVCGEEWIASAVPAWQYDRAAPRALYHPTSWSWLALGLAARLRHSADAAVRLAPCPPPARGGCARSHMRDGVRELAHALRVPPSHLRIGELRFGEGGARSGAAAGGGVGGATLGGGGGARLSHDAEERNIALLLRPYKLPPLPGAPFADCARFAAAWLLSAARLDARDTAAAPSVAARPPAAGRWRQGDGGRAVAAGRWRLGVRVLFALCLLPVALWLCVSRWLLFAVCARAWCWLECACLCCAANCRAFLALALPSSNLIATARPLGRLYGALANGGVCEGSAQVISPQLLAALCAHMMDARRDAPPPGPLARVLPCGRYACGFSPFLPAIVEAGLRAAAQRRARESGDADEWVDAHTSVEQPVEQPVELRARAPAAAGADSACARKPAASPTASFASRSDASGSAPDLSGASGGVGGAALPPPSHPQSGACGARRCVLGHNGVGGCVAYADVDAGLGFVLLKNGYSPEAAGAFDPAGPGLCASARALDALVRAHLPAE
ncbi:hypothetical protein KFE25_011961 [Diacronema lutheri]|uniref:Beta-lactamase-related domain-containing protein n=1 Tax=Diacronema lutheri TaxID=2081491 RepID=A0A8J6C568_DIALT|nr:hypothetical protein KFE25_011961 [Diacronema lutheri]